jgi:hypothetical protein
MLSYIGHRLRDGLNHHLNAALLSEPDGVRHQVQEHLTKSLAVSHHIDSVFGHIKR